MARQHRGDDETIRALEALRRPAGERASESADQTRGQAAGAEGRTSGLPDNSERGNQGEPVRPERDGGDELERNTPEAPEGPQPPQATSDAPAAESAPAHEAEDRPPIPIAPATVREPLTSPPEGVEAVSDEVEVSRGATPHYRCLHCGYPLAGVDRTTCSECGRTYEGETLERWFDGEEARRFEQALWLIVAILFVKLLVLPPLLWATRLGATVLAAWLCVLAWRGKEQTIGGYYAIAGLICCGLMLLFFAWQAAMLPYYTLEMIVGCLALLALLYDPEGGTVAGATPGRRVVIPLLFAIPVFALVCYLLNGVWQAWMPTSLSGTLLETYSPFDFVLPYLAAGVVWLLVWHTVRSLREMFYGRRVA